ncbi:MAG: carboxypeptidase regulatory-like domain-containing protein [Marinobacterium sp.]|nr:carboxypeptidase regulatory-like domain-containing protein [Marinobacterium sp.]
MQTWSAHAETLSVLVTTVDGGAVEGAVVYAEPSAGAVPSELTTPPLLIAQKDKAFAPYIGVVQRNRTVTFTNQDDITHHIYSAAGNSRFSFKIAAGDSHEIIAGAGEPDPFEVISMGCNIHDWMSGYMLVLDTPWFTRTNQQGRAVLSQVEPGTYQLNVWHPQLQAADNRVQQRVELHSDQTVVIELAQPLAPLPEQSGEDDFDFLEEY